MRKFAHAKIVREAKVIVWELEMPGVQTKLNMDVY